ncbi:hypothetical protein STEG23_018348, partial [Scotinomys teguina]
MSSKYHDSELTSRERLYDIQSYVYTTAMELFLFLTTVSKAAMNIDVQYLKSLLLHE